MDAHFDYNPNGELERIHVDNVPASSGVSFRGERIKTSAETRASPTAATIAAANRGAVSPVATAASCW